MSPGVSTAAEPLRMRIGRAIVAPDAIAPAIAAENAGRRIPGLDDRLVVSLIDPAKALAFVGALQSSPAALATLAGRTLLLDGPALGIAYASPTRAAAFQPPLALTITSEHGDVVMARADVAADCALARDYTATARAQTLDADRAAAGLTGPEGGRARELLHAVAQVWSLNAGVAAGCAPGDVGAAAEARAAAEKVRATAVPMGRMG